MGELFVTNQATCICKFGSTPAKLKVTAQQLLFINANKKTATTMDIGNCFYPPAFGVCKFSYPSRPCKVMVTKWIGFYEKMRVNGNAYPLLASCKAACALAGSECIEIMQPGQVEILGASSVKDGSAEHSNELNPGGDLSGVDGLTEEILIVR